MSRLEKTKDGQAARLAEALRENLRKRKTQARARREAADADRSDRSGDGAEDNRDGTNLPRD